MSDSGDSASEFSDDEDYDENSAKNPFNDSEAEEAGVTLLLSWLKLTYAILPFCSFPEWILTILILWASWPLSLTIGQLCRGHVSLNWTTGK